LESAIMLVHKKTFGLPMNILWMTLEFNKKMLLVTSSTIFPPDLKIMDP